ncbi:PdxT/SNO family [Mycena floridula]|nr:PdxT/SNO family [Mycena floridula]
MVQSPSYASIGILALQGAFAEHEASLQRIASNLNIKTVQVRTVDDLARCDALIIPGGGECLQLGLSLLLSSFSPESTTIALLARISGLIEPLREFLRTKPVWGTCAGAILLSESVEGAKKGGQELLGGISISIARNGWGSQIESFEAPLMVDGLRNPEKAFPGVFIRAPVVLDLKPCAADGPPIQIIARLPHNLLPPALVSSGADDPRTIVALRQGLHFLTTFHPELTTDNRFHDYFVRECVLTRSM